MPQRLGIAEAPRAVLGAPGVDQFMPIAERDADGAVTPLSTTVDDMNAYFGGGAPGAGAAVQRFFSQQTNPIQFPIIALQPISRFIGSVLIPWGIRGREVLAGDANAYAVNAGSISVRDAGVYSMTLQAVITYRNQSIGGNWQWAFRARVFPSDTAQAAGIGMIRPAGNPVTAENPMNTATFITRIEPANGIQTEISIGNFGMAASPAPIMETIALDPTPTVGATCLTISRLA